MPLAIGFPEHHVPRITGHIASRCTCRWTEPTRRGLGDPRRDPPRIRPRTYAQARLTQAKPGCLRPARGGETAQTMTMTAHSIGSRIRMGVHSVALGERCVELLLVIRFVVGA